MSGATVTAALRTGSRPSSPSRPATFSALSAERGWSPWSTDPAALRDYTLGEQVTTPFNFAASMRVVLREWAPDLLLLPGPGNSLGGICGRAVVAEGYRGIHDRADFEGAQERDALILSLHR